MVITGNGGGLQHPDMKLALGGGFLCFTLIAALMLWARARVELTQSRLSRAEADAIDLGLDTRTEG
jgi:heme exporter protein C